MATTVGGVQNKRNKSNNNKGTPAQASKRSAITGWGPPSRQPSEVVGGHEDPNYHIKIHDEVDDAVNIGETITGQDQMAMA